MHAAPPFEFARENVPIAPATLYRVGGPARFALFPRDEQEAEAAYHWMRAQPGPKLVLGAGSNVLVAGEGFPGIVFFTTELTRLEELGGDRFHVQGGVPLERLVSEVMVPRNYEGVGALAGIPGSVGGAIYMNAGTVNGSTCMLLEAAELLRAGVRESVEMHPGLYTYRGQQFCGPGDVILAGTFAFTRSQENQQAVYEHYLARRREKQPQGYCCGSVFKNPEGGHAGQLIEACGLKGARRGGAAISEKHANFIMNENNATFEDITALIELARGAVRERFGIELEEEVRIFPAERGG